MADKIRILYTKLTSTGFAHLFGSSVLNKILGLLSSVVIVRLIPKEDYGIYANANNLISMFCIFEGLGMTTALLQYGCTSSGKQKEKIWSFTFYVSMFFQLLLSVVIAICACTFDFSMKGTGPFLLAMSFLPFFRSIRDMQNIYMRTELKNKEFALTNNFYTIVTVVFSIFLSYIFYVYGLITATYVSAIFSILFICFYIKQPLPKFDWSLSKGEKIEITKFAVLSAITNSASMIVYLLDTFILGIVVAQGAVTASYKVALTIPTALAFVPMCVMTYIYPYFAKHAEDSTWCLRNLRKVIVLFGGANCIIVFLLIVAAPQLVALVFGIQYLDSVTSMRILCINYLISATFYTVCGQLLVTLKKIKFNLFLNFFVCAINVVLNLWLIPLYCSNGAAIATTISTIVSAFTCTTFLLYCYQQRMKKKNEA